MSSSPSSCFTSDRRSRTRSSPISPAADFASAACTISARTAKAGRSRPIFSSFAMMPQYRREPASGGGGRLRVAVSTLSQNIHAPSGLLSWFSQLAQFLPEVDPATEYHFVLSEGTRAFIMGRAPKAHADLIGWDSSHQPLRLLSEHLLLGRSLAREGIDVLLMANAGTRPLYLPASVKLVQGIFGFHHLNAADLKPWIKLYRK